VLGVLDAEATVRFAVGFDYIGIDISEKDMAARLQ
jgi:hypothetical protein